MSKDSNKARCGGTWNKTVNTNTAVAHNETYVSQEVNVSVSVGEKIRAKLRGKFSEKFGERGDED